MAVVVSKVFQLLGCFSSGERVLSLAELSRRTNIPKPTVHRIAADLVDLRALERTENGFTLGVVLFDLGGLVAVPRNIRELALPFMGDLYNATHHVVHLGVLDKGEVLYLEKIGGRQLVDVPSRAAGRMPAHCTGIGKALLAFSPEHVVDEILNSPMDRRTPYTITAPEKLQTQLAAARETGVAQESEESALGVACVATPILGADGLAAGAVSVSSRLLELDHRRVIPALRMTALGISRALRQSLQVTCHSRSA